MTTKVVVPKLGMAMSEGVLVEWLVEDGSRVEEGQALFTLENDKSIQDIESPGTGVIKIIGKIGETYDVDVVVAEII